MPSELPVNPDLLKTLLERRLVNQPAGLTTPATMRAMNDVRKFAGAGDLAGVRVEDLPMTRPESFSNTLAQTPVDFGKLQALTKYFPQGKVDPEVIQMNPAVSATFPQGQIASVIAHELQHIRQNRKNSGDTEGQLARFKQFTQPYEDRADEKAAFKEQARFDQGKRDDTLSPLQHGMVQYLAGLFNPSRK